MIDSGLKSFGGYVLGDSVERIVQVPGFPRELSILHRGSLLSMSGEKTVSLFARNLPAIRAVAVTDDRAGVHESRTLVRGDFVLSPNAPTTISPGDEFDVSVGVSNNVEGSGAGANIAVALATDSGLEVVGDTRQSVAIGEGRESSVRFRLRAKDVPGPANLTFTASFGERATARRQIDLSVRPATPLMTRLSAGVLPKGSREIRIERQMYPHHRTLEAGASMLPLSQWKRPPRCMR